MTIPYNHETPDVVACQYCSEDFEKESPYIRYVYGQRYTGNSHHNGIIICTPCFNELRDRKEIVGIRSKTIPPPSNIIAWQLNDDPKNLRP